MQKFLDLNGLFLSTRSITKQMTGEVPDILTFELDSVKEHLHAAKIHGRSEPQVRNKSEAWLNTLQVTPMLDPEAPIEAEDSTGSVKNTFKATFGEIKKYNLMAIVILPFRVPDNLCHFAAQEATMIIDQFIKPNYESQLLLPPEEQDIFKKLDCYFSSIIYQV